MLIRNPINVYPHNITIDPNQRELQFSFTFMGDRLGAYVLKLYEYSNTPLEIQGDKKIYEKFITQFYFVIDDYVYNNTTIQIPLDLRDLALEMGKTYTWNLALAEEHWDEQMTDEDGFNTVKYCFKTAYSPIISEYGDSSLAEILHDGKGSFVINEDIVYYDLFQINPNLNIGTINNRMIDFESYYILNNLVSNCKYYYCRLITDDGNIVDETDKIFSSRIRYTFNGLLSNENYVLEVVVVSQTDQYLRLTIEFAVSYSNAGNLAYAPEISCNLEDNSVDIKWVKDYTSIGKATGEYEILDNQVNIQSGTITYDTIANQPLENYQDFTIAFKSSINDQTTKILTYINNSVNYEIYMENYKFYLKYGANNVQEIGNFKSNIEFGVQNYNNPQPDTGYMWYDNTTFSDSNTYLLVSQNETRKFSFILTKSSDLVQCLVEEVPNE